MTRVFSNGFETADTTPFDSIVTKSGGLSGTVDVNQTVTVGTGYVHAGTYGVHCQSAPTTGNPRGDQYAVNRVGITAKQNAYGRAWVRLDSAFPGLPANGNRVNFIVFYGQCNAALTKVNGTDVFQLRVANSGLWDVADTGFTPTPNTWYQLELVWLSGNKAQLRVYNTSGTQVGTTAEISLIGNPVDGIESVNDVLFGLCTTVADSSTVTLGASLDQCTIDDAGAAPSYWHIYISKTGAGTVDKASQDVAVGTSITVTVTSGTLLNWIKDDGTTATGTSITIPAQTSGTSYSLTAVFEGAPGIPQWLLYLLGGLAVSGFLIAGLSLLRGKRRK